MEDKLNFRIAKLLLEVNAIKLQANNPFIWSSGIKSPIYCDNRILLSFPNYRNLVAKEIANLILQKYVSVDIIAGVATGAIGIGLLVAEKLKLPFIYVRPESKGHGRKNQIEGNIVKNKNVFVIEDLISTANSSIKAIHAIKKAGMNVLGMSSIFTYELKIATNNLKSESIDFFSLSNYSTLIKVARELNYINDDEIEILKEWNRSN
ncbi:MAG: orotate phosphoribosyltransferase [Flavobacteriaceae bacterium]|nr:orotate phosphoribosyltransferase [Flavobacteriaceae bacterium]